MARQSDDLAFRLAAQLTKGDRVLVKLADPVRQLIYFFGIIKAGGVCILADSSTSAEFCADLIKSHQITLYIDENFRLPLIPAASLPQINQADLFLGALSSGTTGTPKLIWRSHQSWTSAFPLQTTVFNLSHLDTIYLAGSLSYTGNLNTCMHLLAEGGTIIMAGNRLPRTWIKEIITNQVTAIFMVPANYRILLRVIKDPLKQIKSITMTGAKLDLKTVQNLVKYFPQAKICEYYGASELGHISYSTTEDLLNHPESVGKAFPGVTLTVEQDMVWVASPYLAPRYSPRATVGDLGRIDQEGYLYLLGRKHRIINTGGVKVIPEQVETILLQCPGITEAVVDGITDPLRGEKVCAWVVKNEPALATGDVFDFCRQRLLPHCCPQQIIFVAELPLNANGKIDRKQLPQD